MIFQIERCSDPIDDTTPGNAQMLSFGMQGDGYIYFEMRVYDNGVDEH